jgi:hypothetical protein
MRFGLVLLFFTGAYPVWIAWKANRSTSLSHAMWWMIAAWASWGGIILGEAATDSALGRDLPRYLALSLTGGAGVAVLGARRPGMAAWNFVVLGLLAVLLLPLAEDLLLATAEPLGFVRKLFLAATVAVGIVNYLPTRLALAAAALALSAAGEFVLLEKAIRSDTETVFWLAFCLCPWLGLIGWRLGRGPASPFDRAWFDFRDRYGLVWAQRVREQFNRAAANAAWPLYLSWRGLRPLPGAPPVDEKARTAAIEALEALFKRFNVVIERAAPVP